MILPNGLKEELQFLDDESKEIVELLFSTNEDDRLVSAVTLQQLGDEDTIPFLIHALDDSSTSVQLIAVTSLWEMANEKAVIPLMKCINSKRVEKVREEACNALKELINQDHLLKLLDLLETEDDTQKIYVLILLRKIHDIQALPSIADFLKSSNPILRKETIITLRYLNQLTHYPPAILLASDPDIDVRKETMLTLSNFDDPDILKTLCKSLIEDESWEVRRNAAQALEQKKDYLSSTFLSKSISDDHWQVRKFSMRALSTVVKEEHLEAIIPKLCDDFSDIRKEAAIALGLIGSEKAIGALSQSLNDSDIEVRIASQKALNKIKT